MKLKYTGEYCILGQTSKEAEDEHIERYKFASQFAKNKNILDLACGTGYGTKMLSEAGAKEVLGVDIDPKLISYAKKFYKLKNTQFNRSDIIEFSHPEKFDMIVSFETIEHIKDDNRAIANYFKLLKRGGLLIISTPNRPVFAPSSTISDQPKNPYHVREYTIPELIKLLRDHRFVIEDVYGQRKRFHLNNLFLKSVYNYLFKPGSKSSPKVTKVRLFVPKYFVLLATK